MLTRRWMLKRFKRFWLLPLAGRALAQAFNGMFGPTG
jgi:hypothetical protein